MDLQAAYQPQSYFNVTIECLKLFENNDSLFDANIS